MTHQPRRRKRKRSTKPIAKASALSAAQQGDSYTLTPQQVQVMGEKVGNILAAARTESDNSEAGTVSSDPNSPVPGTVETLEVNQGESPSGGVVVNVGVPAASAAGSVSANENTGSQDDELAALRAELAASRQREAEANERAELLAEQNTQKDAVAALRSRLSQAEAAARKLMQPISQARITPAGYKAMFGDEGVDAFVDSFESVEELEAHVEKIEGIVDFQSECGAAITAPAATTKSTETVPDPTDDAGDQSPLTQSMNRSVQQFKVKYQKRSGKGAA